MQHVHLLYNYLCSVSMIINDIHILWHYTSFICSLLWLGTLAACQYDIADIVDRGNHFVCCCVHVWSDDCLWTYVISVFVKFPVLVIIHYTCVQLDMQKALHIQCIIHITYMYIHTYAHVYNVLHCTFIDLGGYWKWSSDRWSNSTLKILSAHLCGMV